MLGDKWKAAIPILQVLAFVTPFRVLMHFSGVICDATGTLNSKALLNILYFGVLALLFFLLKDLGLRGFSFGILIAAILKNIGYFFITRKIINLKVSDVLKAYLPGLFSAVITSTFIYFTAFTLENFDLPPAIILLGEIIAGVIGWLFSLYISPDKMVLIQMSEKFGGSLSNNPINQKLSRAIKVLTH